MTKFTVDHFASNGIAFPVKALPPSRADDLLDHYREVQTHFGGRIPAKRNHKIHLLSPLFFDLVSCPEITAPVQSILGPDILCWGSSFFAKEGGDPGFVSWHQDATYWGLSSNDIVTAWIALTPSMTTNGCLRVVAGSHRLPIQSHIETDAPENLLSRGQEIAVEVNEQDAVEVELQPGEMSLHHALIIHGSKPNTSTVPRIGLALRYIATSVSQTGFKAGATPAAGSDEYEHFHVETRPRLALSEGAFEEHDKALAAQQQRFFKDR